MHSSLALRSLLLSLLVLPLAASAAEGPAPVQSLTHEQIEAKYADADSRFADVDGVRIHYKDQGKGPAILLIHGSLGDLTDWDGWVKVLAPRYRVVRIDLPGFGLSGPIANGNYSIDRSLSLVDGLMDTLGLERFAIAGVSYGGPVAWRYAATRTERVTALVIMNSAGVEPGKQTVDPKTGQKSFFQGATGGDVVTREFVEKSLTKSFQDPSRIPPGVVDRKYDQLNVVGRPEEGRIMIHQFVFGTPERILQHVRAPTLMLWGGAERALSQETGERFARSLTRAKVVKKVVQDGGDHYMHLEIPEPTARNVAAFLDAQVKR